MAETSRLSTEEKALRINLDRSIYGSFNEIGAGQEVAANFFRAGGSSGTIAWSRSAYDMKVSDTIYGECQRYVCEDRLLTMLDTEFDALKDMLKDRPASRFFAFCNTVEALNYHKTNQGQGWIGMRFQLEPDGEPNDVVMHVKMHDTRNMWQQEALGILGVNLVYACYMLKDDPEALINSIGDRLSRERMEIDMFRITGPDFKHIDNRLLALWLVKKGMTDATMFAPNGRVLQPTAALYKKNVMVIRGRFRPPTLLSMDMHNKGLEGFLQEDGVTKENMVTLFELTLKDLKAAGDIDEQDFLDRVELLGMLGQTVMISNYVKYYKVVQYLSARTRGKKIGVIMGVYSLETVFDRSYYKNLPGGILQAFGLGFGGDVKLYIYPALKLNSAENELLTGDTLEVPQDLKGLREHMTMNNKIHSVNNVDKSLLHIYSDRVIEMIQGGEAGWENMVPEEVSSAIKEHGLFDYKAVDEPAGTAETL